jgi:hypothetical protein
VAQSPLGIFFPILTNLHSPRTTYSNLRKIRMMKMKMKRRT